MAKPKIKPRPRQLLSLPKISRLTLFLIAALLVLIGVYLVTKSQAISSIGPNGAHFILACPPDERCIKSEGDLEALAYRVQDWYDDQVGKTFQISIERITTKLPANSYRADNDIVRAFYQLSADSRIRKPNTVVLIGFKISSHCGIADNVVGVVDATTSCSLDAALAHELGHTFLSGSNADHTADGSLMQGGRACNGAALSGCIINPDHKARLQKHRKFVVGAGSKPDGGGGSAAPPTPAPGAEPAPPSGPWSARPPRPSCGGKFGRHFPCKPPRRTTPAPKKGPVKRAAPAAAKIGKRPQRSSRNKNTAVKRISSRPKPKKGRNRPRAGRPIGFIKPPSSKTVRRARTAVTGRRTGAYTKAKRNLNPAAKKGTARTVRTRLTGRKSGLVTGKKSVVTKARRNLNPAAKKGTARTARTAVTGRRTGVVTKARRNLNPAAKRGTARTVRTAVTGRKTGAVNRVKRQANPRAKGSPVRFVRRAPVVGRFFKPKKPQRQATRRPPQRTAAPRRQPAPRRVTNNRPRGGGKPAPRPRGGGRPAPRPVGPSIFESVHNQFRGQLGNPTGGVFNFKCGNGTHGRQQKFQRGNIYSTGHGTFAIWGHVHKVHSDNNGACGKYGPPKGSGDRNVPFEKGRI